MKLWYNNAKKGGGCMAESIDREIAKELYNQCGTIRRILIASSNTAKENK